jgi:hypothetical protein
MAMKQNFLKTILLFAIFLLFIADNTFAVDEKPIEKHSLLGNPVLMDYMTCAKKYGDPFCKCKEDPQGTTFCYYYKPPAGYYTKDECEHIWGAGACVEDTPDQWMKSAESETAKPAECDGSIMIFPGALEECRSKTGIIGLGGSCCKEKTGEACSFENTAEELGWDDAVIKALEKATEFAAQKWAVPVMSDWMKESIGAAFVGGDNPVTQYLTSSVIQENFASVNMDGTLLGDIWPDGFGSTALDGITSQLETLGVVDANGMAQEAITAYSDVLSSGGTQKQAVDATKTFLNDQADLLGNADLASEGAYVADNLGTVGESFGGASSQVSDAFASSAMSGVVSIGFAMLDGELTSEEMTDAIVGMGVAFAAELIPGIGYVYMAYKVYNMLTAKVECLPGEKILACKVGEDYCHYVGERCTNKIFGFCLEKKKSYCCFNSVLARIIHEQGRVLLGDNFTLTYSEQDNGGTHGVWGNAEDPLCRGFYPDEFALIDFSKLDLSEYEESIMRRSAIDMTKTVENALQTLTTQTGMQ